MMKKVIVLSLFVFLCGILIFFFGKKYYWTTETALKSMQESPFYSKLHATSNTTDNKLTEIFLEIGNYSWGGYRAILFIETQDEVRCYSYLFHKESFEFNENIINKSDFTRFFDELVKQGLWKIKTRLYNPFVDPVVDDGSTYFLTVMRGRQKKHVIVYSPELIEGAKIHWNIIKHIQDFCMKYIEENETVEKPHLH